MGLPAQDSSVSPDHTVFRCVIIKSKRSVFDDLFPFLVAIHHAKVEIRLIKKDPSIHWGSVGTMLPGNDEMTAKINRGL